MYALSAVLLSAGIILGAAMAKLENPRTLIEYISASASAGFQIQATVFFVPMLLDLFTITLMCLSAIWTPAFIPSELIICMRGFIIGFYSEALREAFGFKGVLISLFGMAMWKLPLLIVIATINARAFEELLIRFTMAVNGYGDETSAARLFRRIVPLTVVAFICDSVAVPLILRLLVSFA